jgi:hypothetical protein
MFNYKAMASTPILKGQEAISFLNNWCQRVSHVPTQVEIRAQEIEMANMKASYEALKSISDGTILV